MRRAGESWDALEQRAQRMRPRDFGADARRRDTSLRALDPTVEPTVVRLCCATDSRASRRARWVAFRRWVLAYPGGAFRLIGTPAHTWDWRHARHPMADNAWTDALMLA